MPPVTQIDIRMKLFSPPFSAVLSGGNWLYILCLGLPPLCILLLSQFGPKVAQPPPTLLSRPPALLLYSSALESKGKGLKSKRGVLESQIEA